MYMQIHMCTHAYIHTYIHTYIYIYIHTQIFSSRKAYRHRIHKQHKLLNYVLNILVDLPLYIYI